MSDMRKSRAKFEKLTLPDAQWRLVDNRDVFSLPELPPGKEEHLTFNPKVLPPKSNEFFILDSIWDSEVHRSFIKERNQNGDWSYGPDREKRWHLTEGLTNVIIGIILTIRADSSAKIEAIPLFGRKILRNDLSSTVKEVIKLLKEKWPRFVRYFPGVDLIERFIANCLISPENEALISKKLTKCILPGHSSRRMSNDEKGAKFTGNSKNLLLANKPENKIVSWTATSVIETRHTESFLIHAKTHRSKDDGPQTIWNEFYSNWSEVFFEVGNEATVAVTDSHYMCDEVLRNLLERKIKFISGFDENKFREITSLIAGRGEKAGEWAALYNKKLNLLLMKRTDHDGKTKRTMSNYLVHFRGYAKQSDLHQWYAYDAAYYLSDRMNQQIMTKLHRRWPFRHGSFGHHGFDSHVFDILWCFIIEDVRVAYRSLQFPDINKPKYAPFVASLAFHLIEKGLAQLESEKRKA